MLFHCILFYCKHYLWDIRLAPRHITRPHRDKVSTSKRASSQLRNTTTTEENLNRLAFCTLLGVSIVKQRGTQSPVHPFSSTPPQGSGGPTEKSYWIIRPRTKNMKCTTLLTHEHMKYTTLLLHEHMIYTTLLIYKHMKYTTLLMHKHMIYLYRCTST